MSDSDATSRNDAADQQPAVADPFDPKTYQGTGIMGGDACSQEPAAAAGTTTLTGQPVKLIAFDMGHVFVDFDWEEVCKGFMSKSGRSRDDLRAVMAHVAALGYERGLVGTLDFLRELNCQLGVTLSLDEFRTIWNNTFQENPDMAALLQLLSGRLPLYLLSNTNEEHYNFLQSTFNVARHFRELILSYEVGYSKPDERIYEEVLKRSGLPAANILFVDDLTPNVNAARALGMQAIQFTGIDNLKKDLQALGVMP